MGHEIQTIHNQLGLQQSALTEFITVLLPILQRKFDHILPDLRKNGSLLSHFMHESLSFDSVIREKYLYIPTGSDKWEGITQYFLRSPATFKTWRDAEKDCT
jgi:RAD50-interacting protein 1